MDDVLNAEELQQIRDFAQAVIDDPQLSGSITYQSFVGRGTFDPLLGKVAQTFAGTWVHTYSRPITDHEVKMANGHYQTGDWFYYIAPRDVVLPKKDDRIVDGGRTRYVYEFTTDSIKTFHVIVARDI